MSRNKEYHYDIREFQLRSLVLIDAIDQVCKEHHLNYYVIAGTLLGAKRHGGFIPWDDDMDIGLMRKDYDMLLEHADEWLPEPFFIVTHENTPHYPKYFAKLEDTSTTLVENFYLGYAGGIYLDIFPLDDVPDNKWLRAIHYYKFNLLRKIQYFQFRDPYKHGHGPSSWLPLLARKLFSREGIYNKLQQVLRQYNGHKNCHYVMTHDDKLKAYPTACLGQPKAIQFEGRTVMAPSDIDTFLTVMYGPDHMQLPPVERRTSHFHNYCDFNTPYRSVDFEALKKKTNTI